MQFLLLLPDFLLLDEVPAFVSGPGQLFPGFVAEEQFLRLLGADFLDAHLVGPV